jgi:hypothetical protein
MSISEFTQPTKLLPVELGMSISQLTKELAKEPANDPSNKRNVNPGMSISEFLNSIEPSSTSNNAAETFEKMQCVGAQGSLSEYNYASSTEGAVRYDALGMLADVTINKRWQGDEQGNGGSRGQGQPQPPLSKNLQQLPFSGFFTNLQGQCATFPACSSTKSMVSSLSSVLSM